MKLFFIRKSKFKLEILVTCKQFHFFLLLIYNNIKLDYYNGILSPGVTFKLVWKCILGGSKWSDTFVVLLKTNLNKLWKKWIFFFQIAHMMPFFLFCFFFCFKNFISQMFAIIVNTLTKMFTKVVHNTEDHFFWNGNNFVSMLIQ